MKKDYDILDVQEKDLAHTIAEAIQYTYARPVYDITVSVTYRVYSDHPEPLRSSYIIIANCPKYLVNELVAFARGYVRAYHREAGK